MAGKIVVRTYAPAWRWGVLAAVLLMIALSLFIAFELGLYKAGFDAVAAQKARSALQRQVDQLQQTQRQLRLQLAVAEEARVADVRERAEVARTIGELQAQLERQQEDVEFYRGLVTQPSPAGNVTVRVQQFHITAGTPSPSPSPSPGQGQGQTKPSSQPQAQSFLLHFTLNRVTQAEQPISGTLVITVDGTQNALPAAVDLAELTGGKDQLPFDFRYYAHFDQPISLPVAFKPASVTIELRPARKGVSAYRQTFIWEVDPI